MIDSVPDSVLRCQPLSVFAPEYRIRMEPLQPSTYLWANICALAGVPESTSVDKMHKRLREKVARGTVQRIKAQDGHRGTDQLQEIAAVLGVEVWQLLMPGVSRQALPMAPVQPITGELSEALRSASPSTRLMVENAARAMLGLPVIPLESGELRNGTNG